MNANVQNLTTTLYFGLSVEVVHAMKNCSWVRFSGHDAIVDTDDLAPVQGLRPPLSLQRSFPETAQVLHNRVAAGR